MCRILIVQEEGLYRGLLRGILEEKGSSETRLVEAGGNSEALHELHQAEPNLVFLDLTFYESHALELIGKIKHLFPQTIVVVLIDSDIPEYRDAAYGHGADHVFVKSALCLKEIVAATHTAPSCAHH